jgi:hypothetical protein
MDSARIINVEVQDGEPRRPRRRRWLVALGIAALAAPLGSGSALALTGPAEKPAPVKRVVKVQYDAMGTPTVKDGHLCPEGRAHRRGPRRESAPATQY